MVKCTPKVVLNKFQAIRISLPVDLILSQALPIQHLVLLSSFQDVLFPMRVVIPLLNLLVLLVALIPHQAVLVTPQGILIPLPVLQLAVPIPSGGLQVVHVINLVVMVVTLGRWH